MKKKVAQVIADFLVEKGVTEMFTITGGGAMHLNDAFGHKEGLHCIYNHHEQGCSIAAEAYARYTGRIAAVCVTSGPGGTNAITGVVGGYQDSIPMFVVSGQVKRETLVRSTSLPLRQLGDQEFNMVDCAKLMTKYAAMIWEAEDVLYHLEKAWYLANNGRKGPVWLDVPLDIQAAVVETEELTKHFDPVAEGYEKSEHPAYDESLTDVILERIKASHRPLLFAGTAINFADAKPELAELAELLQIPVVTAWNAHDLLPSSSPLDAGRPGTVGNRGGNFAVMTCDLLFVLGSRLNIRLASYNYRDFGAQAYRIMVDIDENELKKPTVAPDLPINADVKTVMLSLINRIKERLAAGESREDIVGDCPEWRAHCKKVNDSYPACMKQYYETDSPINHYVFNERLFKDHLADGDAVICGNGAACVVTFQSCFVKNDQRIFTNSGCAAMGYGFPAALGVAVAREAGWRYRDGRPVYEPARTGTEEGDKSTRDRVRTICIDGDGSFQMNIQELQTVVYSGLNLKIIIINNNGYHSIRQTQRNLFSGREFVGIDRVSGVSFPDLSKLAPAYGLPYFRVTSQSDMDSSVRQFLSTVGPALMEVIVDENQGFEPKLSSKVMPDGSIVSPPQDDMYPFLPRQEYEGIKKAALEI